MAGEGADQESVAEGVVLLRFTVSIQRVNYILSPGVSEYPRDTVGLLARATMIGVLNFL